MTSVKSTRSIIETDNPNETLIKHINDIPGIRYRELLRLTGLSNGVLAYHLNELEKSYQIRVDRQREKKTTRYYSVSIPTQESDILRQLRNNVSRQIIKFILNHDLCTFNEIVGHLGKAASTVSWHLNRLKQEGLIFIRYGGENQLYQIMNRELVCYVISKYKESLVDRVIDNYTEMVEEL